MPVEGVETRSSKTEGAGKHLTEKELEAARNRIAIESAELDALRATLKTQQKKIAAESAALEKQRVAFEKEREVQYHGTIRRKNARR